MLMTFPTPYKSKKQKFYELTYVCSSSSSFLSTSLFLYTIENPIKEKMIDIIGTLKFKMAYGAYAQALTPSVLKINTASVLQGTKGEVIVPPSSSARDKFLACRFLSWYASAYIRPGIIIDIYCSAVKTFIKKDVTTVVAHKLLAVRANFNICSTITRNISVLSIRPPNIIATIANETVYIIESNPPWFNRSFTVSFSDSTT